MCGWFLLLILFVWPWFNPIPFSRSHFVKRFAKSSSLRELSGQQSIFLRFHFANQKKLTHGTPRLIEINIGRNRNQSVLFSSGCLIFNNVQIWSFVTRGQRHLWEYYHENGATKIAHLILSSFPSFVQINIKTTSYRMSVAPWDCFKGFECALKALKILHTYITTDTLTD